MAFYLLKPMPERERVYGSDSFRDNSSLKEVRLGPKKEQMGHGDTHLRNN